MYILKIIKTYMSTGKKDEIEIKDITKHGCYTQIKLFMKNNKDGDLHISFKDISEFLRFENWKEKIKRHD